MKEHTLEECVKRNLDLYFKNIDGETPSGVWDMVISAVEKPILEVMMARTFGNQSRAAKILGINRNTLRNKLEHYQIKY